MCKQIAEIGFEKLRRKLSSVKFSYEAIPVKWKNSSAYLLEALDPIMEPCDNLKRISIKAIIKMLFLLLTVKLVND